MSILRVLGILIVLTAIPEMSVAQTNSQTDTSQQSQSGFQPDTLTYTVYGMDCPGCEGGLEKQVNKIPNVKYSKANWINQELRIVVEQDSVLNIRELEKRVKKANFTLEAENLKKEL